jgi:C-terminal processing protease CtpA/Prc
LFNLALIKNSGSEPVSNMLIMKKLFFHYFQGAFRRSPAIIILSLLFLVACKDDEDPVPVSEITNATNSHINSWIYENMSYWYLWNDQLPENADKNVDPESYFNSLLYSDDRFSWIQDNYQELLNALQGISREAGYEYVLYREKENSDNVLLQILYIKPLSPAATSGLTRGDVITHINNEQITVNNYQTLLESTRQDHTVQYKPQNVDAETFGEPKSASLSAVQYAENPNYLHKVIETGGKKIGYFVYNFFAEGTESEQGIYDAEMDAIFTGFKSAGINELVLDLRFNSGGSESSAKNLASLIGKNIDQSKVFLKREYNEQVEKAILSDNELGESFLISNYLNKPNNIGNQLSSGRVYILTSSRTASASELIINALKPYMEVFLIGDTTYGKNVGSISLFEENDPKNTWGIQPIVVKVFNSLDQSDYSTGFEPQVLDKDNSLFLYPLGDSREALLSQALNQIAGISGREKAGARQETREPIAHSLDFKRRSFNLTVDSPLGVVREQGDGGIKE